MACIAVAGRPAVAQPLRRAFKQRLYHELWRDVIRLFLAAERT
jgi:hypothetical protein